MRSRCMIIEVEAKFKVNFQGVIGVCTCKGFLNTIQRDVYEKKESSINFFGV